MAGRGGAEGKTESGAGHWSIETRNMYKVHRRNESSKTWRSRYTPRWKSLYKDWARRLGCRCGTIYSNAASQLDHRRATLSRSSVRKAPESNLEAKYAKQKVNTNFKADNSPSRAGALKHADALDTQRGYTPGNHNSGGGRTEKTRDRGERQRIRRSENDNRTRAHRRKITTGMASADGWTTFPAERQGAVIEMRAGQRGGPLPFEASFDFGERIIKTKVTAKRWLRRTRDINSGVFCNRVCVTLKSRKPFLDKENREGGANNLVFEFRGNQTDAPDERGRRIERETHVRINDAAQRRTWTKHQPIRVLRLRAASLLGGVHLGEGGRGNERAISDRSSVIVQRHGQTRHQPIQRRARRHETNLQAVQVFLPGLRFCKCPD